MKTIGQAILFTVLIFLSSCVSSSSYNLLLEENIKLKGEVAKLEEEIVELEYEIESIEEKKKLNTLHTDVDAYKLIEDYYDFYRAGYEYRNPRVRKQSYNVFKVSLQEANKGVGN